MKKMPLLCLFLCFLFSSEAQKKCDLLYGKWVFTRWQTDQVLMDFEDSAATIQNKFQQIRQANNGAPILQKDSLEIIQEFRNMLDEIRKNGFISFTINKDKTFSWKGTVNDPNEKFTGTFSCKDDTLTFSCKKGKGDSTAQSMILKIVSFSTSKIIVVWPSPNDPNNNNSTMSFKKVQ